MVIAGSNSERPAAMIPRRRPDFASSLSRSEDEDLDRMEMGGTKMWMRAAQAFETQFDQVEYRIHRFPASLRGLGSRYIVPKVVAIGPYHRGLDHLKEMEKVKLVAAYHFILNSDASYGEMLAPVLSVPYEKMQAAVLSVADTARSLYANFDSVAAIGDAEFVEMMLLDGCFLLQYMLMFCDLTHNRLYTSLQCCFDSHQACISNDIMLLENQMPWVVLEAILDCSTVMMTEDVLSGIAKMGRTLEPRGGEKYDSFALDGYVPPHLLGLLRFYTAGSKTIGRRGQYYTSDEVIRRPMSKTISAAELAQIGIKLTPSRTTKLWDMGIKETPLFGHIFLPPLLLDEMRSCWLVNMAAFEVCVATDFLSGTELPVVCSYLALLAMLMDREEDVHKLRSKRLVQGELTNTQTIDFFKSLINHITGGPLYISILEEIENYRIKRWMWIKVHKFVYKNYKTIATLLSVIGVLVGIFKTILLVSRT